MPNDWMDDGKLWTISEKIIGKPQENHHVEWDNSLFSWKKLWVRFNRIVKNSWMENFHGNPMDG